MRLSPIYKNLIHMLTDATLIASVTAFISPILSLILFPIPLFCHYYSRPKARYTFVPDPLSIEFQTLANYLKYSITSVRLKLIPQAQWTLYPVLQNDGTFLPYTIDTDPKHSRLIIQYPQGKITCNTAHIHPQIPLPITITDTPQTFLITPCPKRTSIRLSPPRTILLPLQYTHLTHKLLLTAYLLLLHLFPSIFTPLTSLFILSYALL